MAAAESVAKKSGIAQDAGFSPKRSGEWPNCAVDNQIPLIEERSSCEPGRTRASTGRDRHIATSAGAGGPRGLLTVVMAHGIAPSFESRGLPISSLESPYNQLSCSSSLMAIASTTQIRKSAVDLLALRAKAVPTARGRLSGVSRLVELAHLVASLIEQLRTPMKT